MSLNTKDLFLHGEVSANALAALVVHTFLHASIHVFHNFEQFIVDKLLYNVHVLQYNNIVSPY